jgi:hypothetical protein
VSYRSGVLTRPDVVNVMEHRATKVNVFPAPQGGGSPQGANLQTVLNLHAWVQESRYGANAWIDVHIFDDRDELIRSDGGCVGQIVTARLEDTRDLERVVTY